MSQENVDLLAVAGQAFNTRDLDTFLSLMHPDIEWDAGVLGTPIYRGMEGVREMLADVETSWTGFRIEFLGQPIGSGDALVARCRLSDAAATPVCPWRPSNTWPSPWPTGVPGAWRFSAASPKP